MQKFGDDSKQHFPITLDKLHTHASKGTTDDQLMLFHDSVPAWQALLPLYARNHWWSVSPTGPSPLDLPIY